MPGFTDLSVDIVGMTPNKPSPNGPSYVQAIPLYTRSDGAVFGYFKEHRDEIDALTGTTLVIALPEEVAEGKVTALTALFGPMVKAPRYPGLLRSDLPCFWLEDSSGKHEIMRLPDQTSQVIAYIRALTDATAENKSAPAIKSRTYQILNINTAERSPLARIIMGELPVAKSTERLLALIFGVVFVAAILALAVFIPTPSPFQYTVFRIVLALAAAGFVSMTPGFLEVNIPNFVRAGGALAVFVIVYFYDPVARIVGLT